MGFKRLINLAKATVASLVAMEAANKIASDIAAAKISEAALLPENTSYLESSADTLERSSDKVGGLSTSPFTKYGILSTINTKKSSLYAIKTGAITKLRSNYTGGITTGFSFNTDNALPTSKFYIFGYNSAKASYTVDTLTSFPTLKKYTDGRFGYYGYYDAVENGNAQSYDFNFEVEGECPYKILKGLRLLTYVHNAPVILRFEVFALHTGNGLYHKIGSYENVYTEAIAQNEVSLNNFIEIPAKNFKITATVVEGDEGSRKPVAGVDIDTYDMWFSIDNFSFVSLASPNDAVESCELQDDILYTYYNSNVSDIYIIADTVHPKDIGAESISIPYYRNNPLNTAAIYDIRVNPFSTYIIDTSGEHVFDVMVMGRTSSGFMEPFSSTIVNVDKSDQYVRIENLTDDILDLNVELIT